MHACYTFKMQPELPFRPNVNPASKSSHHANFEAGSTCWWFGGVFLSMSVQKLAIWANPISTFYKVAIVGLAKKLQTTTTHNTQNTTTNQNDPLLSYPPAGLASIAMATSAMAPNLGAESFHESMQYLL
jgi:hypothetical protein